MAGVKGRSGGPRQNSGGARPGAGAKPKPPTLLQLAGQHEDPAKFLAEVMNDSATDVKLRVDAAKALMPYVHTRKADAGKKETKTAKAREVAKRFSAAPPPKLAAVGGKTV